MIRLKDLREEIILHDLCGPNLIMEPKCGRRRQKSESDKCGLSRRGAAVAGFEDEGERP